MIDKCNILCTDKMHCCLTNLEFHNCFVEKESHKINSAHAAWECSIWQRDDTLMVT